MVDSQLVHIDDFRLGPGRFLYLIQNRSQALDHAVRSSVPKTALVFKSGSAPRVVIKYQVVYLELLWSYAEVVAMGSGLCVLLHMISGQGKGCWRT